MRFNTCTLLLSIVLAACGNNAEERSAPVANDTADEELFDRRIGFQQIMQRLRDDDAGRVSRTIVQLTPMSERREVEKLLVAVWERDRPSFPELNWSVLESERVRISIARVLGKWRPDDLRYREYVREMSDHATSNNEKVEALTALGSLGHEEDLERLKKIAIGADELLATGALAGLVMSNKEAAVREVERISTDTAMPEQRRKLARQLLAMPRPKA